MVNETFFIMLCDGVYNNKVYLFSFNKFWWSIINSSHSVIKKVLSDFSFYIKSIS